MSQEEEIRLHKQRWKNWNEQRQRQNMRKKLNVEEGMETYATNLIKKIGTNNQQNNKKIKTVDNNIKKQLQSNICSICLQLMIPPKRQPVMLVPCGHNICKDCLFVRPPSGILSKNLALKLEKCSLCRNKIESYALNQSLMALICMYSDNKQLLQKQTKRMQEQALQKQNSQKNQGLIELKLRCQILQNQKNNLEGQHSKYIKQKTIISQVIDTLKKQKKKNQIQMQKLQQQAKLINKTLNQKIQDMEIIQKKLKQVIDKERVVDRALIPLKKQKEKQQLLQIARLINKQ